MAVVSQHSHSPQEGLAFGPNASNPDRIPRPGRSHCIFWISSSSTLCFFSFLSFSSSFTFLAADGCRLRSSPSSASPSALLTCTRAQRCGGGPVRFPLPAPHGRARRRALTSPSAASTFSSPPPPASPTFPSAAPSAAAGSSAASALPPVGDEALGDGSRSAPLPLSSRPGSPGSAIAPRRAVAQ